MGKSSRHSDVSSDESPPPTKSKKKPGSGGAIKKNKRPTDPDPGTNNYIRAYIQKTREKRAAKEASNRSSTSEKKGPLSDPKNRTNLPENKLKSEKKSVKMPEEKNSMRKVVRKLQKSIAKEDDEEEEDDDDDEDEDDKQRKNKKKINSKGRPSVSSENRSSKGRHSVSSQTSNSLVASSLKRSEHSSGSAGRSFFVALFVNSYKRFRHYTVGILFRTEPHTPERSAYDVPEFYSDADARSGYSEGETSSPPGKSRFGFFARWRKRRKRRDSLRRGGQRNSEKGWQIGRWLNMFRRKRNASPEEKYDIETAVVT